MSITITALKEKLRKKYLYIVCGLSLFLLLLFGSDSGTLLINGKPVTGYESLAPILLSMVNAVSCFLAMAMSLGTIPNEYERKTSHLIWMRKISQHRYHGELALANMLAGIMAESILFLAMLAFVYTKGESRQVITLIPAFFLIAICVAICSLFTSALSIIFSKAIAGALSAGIVLMGIFHDVISLLKNIVGGFTESVLRLLLKFIPNLNGIKEQAVNVMNGHSIEIHEMLKGLFAIYIAIALILLFRRKEA